MKEARKKCEHCNREIKGAEYYTKFPSQPKRVLLCEECYLEDK